jgi:ankyrin repeat protein
MAIPSCTVHGVIYGADVLSPLSELLAACDQVLGDFRQGKATDLSLIHAWHRIGPETKALLGHSAGAVPDWAYRQFLAPDYHWNDACLDDLLAGGLQCIARCSTDGETPLMHAAELNNVPNAEALLAAGVDPNGANDVGATALHVAAKFGDLDVLFALLRRGANPNIQDVRFWTPLHETVDARSPCLKTVAALVEFGVDLRLRNLDRETVLDLARDNPAIASDPALMRHVTPEVDGFSL